jgi:uncharacterized protein YjbI with pentapeptide repeats
MSVHRKNLLKSVNKHMNDVDDNADWEKLVALSDEELEAAIAKQKRDTQPSTKKSLPQDVSEVATDWDYLLEPSAKGAAQQSANNSTFTDWETTDDSLKSQNGKDRDSLDEAWSKASEEVNTEFAQQWEESAAQILNHNQDRQAIAPNPAQSLDLSPNISPTSNWEYNLNADEVIPDWEQFAELSPEHKSDSDITASWQIDTDEVNTEFMQEWEQSAARISELTGIDLSDGIKPDQPAKPKVSQFAGSQLNPKMPAQSSDESGPLPPLPVLPPKKIPAKKTILDAPHVPQASKPQSPQNPVNASAINQAPIADSNLDWFEKYQDESEKVEPKSPTPTYHFNQLAEEMCESDEFSWANLNPKAQTQPVAKTWNPAEKIIVDLDDDQIDATAVWNYNPPESFTETGLVSDFEPTPSFDFRLAVSQFYEDVYVPFWRKFKIPIIAIASVGGLFALYLIPPVQRVVTEVGLKSQLLKDASQKDLSASNFQDAKLEKVNFTNANLSGANFKKANLNGANLSGSNLKGANFLGANLRAARLKDSKIELKGDKTTKLEPKDLLMWRIINQPITARNLSNQNLDGFYLGGAMLKKVNFTGAKLPWVNFMNADLSEAQFAGATITGVNLVGANLKGANFGGVTWGRNEPRTDNTTTCANGSKGPCKF